MSKMVKLLCVVSLFALISVTLWAQGIFATLTGVVNDPSEDTTWARRRSRFVNATGSASPVVTMPSPTLADI